MNPLFVVQVYDIVADIAVCHYIYSADKVYSYYSFWKSGIEIKMYCVFQYMWNCIFLGLSPPPPLRLCSIQFYKASNFMETTLYPGTIQSSMKTSQTNKNR